MDVGWAAAIPALITAVSTIIIRVCAKDDARKVANASASPEQVSAVEAELAALKKEFEILRNAYFKQNPVTDHRSPK